MKKKRKRKKNLEWADVNRNLNKICERAPVKIEACVIFSIDDEEKKTVKWKMIDNIFSVVLRNQSENLALLSNLPFQNSSHCIRFSLMSSEWARRKAKFFVNF